MKLAFCPTGEGGGRDNSCSRYDTSKISFKMENDIESVPLNTWAKSEDGNEYRFKTSDDRTWYVKAWTESKPLEFTFGEVGVEDEYTIFNDRKAFEVFRNVVPAVLGYIEKSKPESFTFSASKASRVELYSRLARTFALKHPEYLVRSHVLSSSGVWVASLSDANLAFCPTGEGGGVDNSCSRYKNRFERALDGADIKVTDEFEEELLDTWQVVQRGNGSELYELKFETKEKRLFTIESNFYKAAKYLTFNFKDPNNSYGITGEGEQFQIFSKVVPAVVALIDDREAEAIEFTAEEPSRQRLYSRLVKTILKLRPEYEATTTDNKSWFEIKLK